ncbi:PHP domain-containing protein [Clostridium rectalis]|uniref:PHP domain-containing protein n=1 Tax=Clostridium rectalis TaxID=2040295 RepID=UPI000F632100|nr:PHP domain-containing protein [Clostridium rectalis]
MFLKGDFHIHSNASDGKYSPSQIINMAVKENVDILSLTDHDTTDGLDIAIESGRNLNLKVIPGIELSTTYKGEKIHLLGYFKNNEFNDPTFQKFLKNIKDYRIYRGEKIIHNLQKYFNINLNYNKILRESKGIIARPVIAKAIHDSYNYDWNYIFDKFIGDSSPAYIPNKHISLQDGISMLSSINSLIVLAHPILIKKVSIDEILKFSIHGIECIYPLNTTKNTEYFINKANQYNKIISAGSDFHGMCKKDNSHGNYIGEVFLNNKYIDIFLKKIKELSNYKMYPME